MKVLRRLSSLLVLMLVSFLALGTLTKVNAETTITTSLELTVEGAAVRTTGKPGIRIVASVNDYDTTNVEMYGMVIVFGKCEATDDFVVGGTVNGNKVMMGYKYEVNSSNQYNVTIYNFPESLYLSTLSARAFVKLTDGSYIYGEHVLQRSLGEVILKAINNGSDGEGNLIGEVESIITSTEAGVGYMKYGFDSFGNFTVSNLYETDPTRLRDIFISDYNTYLDTLVSDGVIPYASSIGADSEFDEYFYSMTPRIVAVDETTGSITTYNIAVNAENADASTSPLYMFLNDEMYGDKWGWILDYFLSFDEIHLSRQVTAIRNGGTCLDSSTNTNYVLYNLNHLIGSIWNFFNQSDIVEETNNGWPGTKIFETAEDYSTIVNYNNRIYADLSKYDVAKIGSTILLPDASVDTNVNTGYNENNYQINDEIVVDAVGSSYIPDYQTAFAISFLDASNNSLNTLIYDGLTDIVFDAYEPEGYVFEGWYDNIDCTGTPIKGLSAGTTGDKTYYAKLYKGTHIVVDPSYSSQTTGDVVTVKGVDYVFGTTAFASVLDAINQANTLTTGTTLIELASGTYEYEDGSNSTTITGNNIKVIGPNVNVAGTDVREEEAVLNNVFITINSNLSNIEFNGLKFTGNSKIYNRDTTYGLAITGFTFTNNYVTSTNSVEAVWSSSSTGFIEFDAVGTYYSTNVAITNNYFEHDLTNNVTSSLESELIALDNVCDLNLSNNTFKNIKDIAVHVYDTKKGLSGETVKLNNNTFENVAGDALRINWMAPTNATGTNNTVEIEGNTFTDVTGKCISVGYTNSNGNGVAGNSSDYYKEISISGNTFNSVSEDYIYLYRCYQYWTLVMNDNVFNAIPSGYYMYVYSAESTNYYPENTSYNSDGSALNINAVDSTKFTSNVKYAQEYTITYMYNGQAITSLADTYYESDEAYALATYSVTNGVFEGWYDNPEFTGSAITEIVAGDKGDKVYYAKMTIYYTITYIYDGTELTDLAPTTYKQGESFELPVYEVSDSSKYIFEGWYTNSNLTTGYIEEVTSTTAENLVLYAKVTIVKTNYAVDDDWASKAAGDTVTLNDESYVYGTNAFSTIASAITAVNALGTEANVNINVAAGTYTGDFTISTSGVKLSGPNEGIDGNATRADEAIINNSIIYFAAQVGDIEINGFKFAGTSKIYKTDKTLTGTSSSLTTDIDGFTFANNYVLSANLYGFVHFTDSSYNYSKDLVFTNNYFAHDLTTSGLAATYFLRLNNVYNLVITNNTFANIYKTAVYVDGSSVGLIGEHSEICGNTFDTIGADAVVINEIDPISNSGTPKMEFDENTFRSVTGTCIKIGALNGNSNLAQSAYSYISMSNNIFDVSLTNGIYVTTHSASMNLMISGNIFNVIPSSYYIYIGSTIAVYALGNEYLDGGVAIESVSSSKFSSNVVYEPQPIEIVSMGAGNGVVKVGETIQYTANYAGGTWTSSNTTVATVDETGLITAISAGSADITVEFEGSSFSSGVTVYDDTYSALMQLILQNNTGILLNQDVTYIGYVSGYERMVHNIYDSANNYWPGTITIDSTSYKLSSSDGNYGVAMTPKYITVHDTGSTTTNAKQTSAWCLNSSNTSSSWHYSTGTDGVYQHIPDTITAGHAGDGSRAYGFTKTQVQGTPGSTVQLPVTIKDGYFYLGGQYTGVAAPTTSTTNLPTIGIYHYVGSDGYYYLANTYYNSTYKTISMKGGNRHSIGIESSVKYGTDIYLTWQMTAKLVAQLCVKWDLNTAQVRQHNNFSGKDCPGTMRNAGLWDEFMEIVEVEYAVLKNYSGWTISFDSSNESYLYNNGRVQNRPEETVGTSYTVTVTSPSGVVETAELYVIIPGHENNIMNKWE